MNKEIKIVATIEARMTSSRLPGKVLMEASGQSMLYHLVERLKSVESIEEIVLATTVNCSDDVLIEEAKNLNIGFFRGDENNVMLRVIEAAESVNADVVVEITADCPIIDPQIIEQAILTYVNNDADYVGNANVRSYPDGMDVQVFSLHALKKSFELTSDQLELEHVTLNIRRNPKIFKHINLISPPELYWPELGLTLDEEDDYKLIKEIIEKLSHKSLFSCLDIISFLKKNQDLLNINSHVLRKGDS